MKKKLLFVWFVIIAGLFVWINQRKQAEIVKNVQQKKMQQATPQDQNSGAGTEVPFPVATQVQTQADTLDIESHPAYADVRNYQMSDEELLEKWQGREEQLADFLYDASAQTVACLKKDLCGEKPEPGSPYFNPNATPAHSFLERQLGTLIHMRESGKLDVTAIPTAQIEEVLDIENAAIQTMALELRLAPGVDDPTYQRLLDRTPSLLPQASASALAQLANESRSSQQRRDALINTAEKLLTAEDQTRAVEMAKRVKYLKTDRTEIERLAASTCNLLPQNRQTVEHHLAIAAEASAANLNFDCP